MYTTHLNIHQILQNIQKDKIILKAFIPNDMLKNLFIHYKNDTRSIEKMLAKHPKLMY